MQGIKQYLKQTDKTQIRKMLKECDLTELEYWVIYYAYIEKRMVENTCMKLNISRAYYFIIKNKALIKLHFTINRHQKV